LLDEKREMVMSYFITVGHYQYKYIEDYDEVIACSEAIYLLYAEKDI